MSLIDIASIVFVCVTMNHLGLIAKVEEIAASYGELRGVTGKLFLVLNCPKCCTMWCVLAYGLWSVGFSDMPSVLAVSFLASYVAIWLELLEGFIDTLYMKLYGKIYETSDDTPAADSNGSHSAGTVS